MALFREAVDDADQEAARKVDGEGSPGEQGGVVELEIPGYQISCNGSDEPSTTDDG